MGSDSLRRDASLSVSILNRSRSRSSNRLWLSVTALSSEFPVT
jgi:hypothetical protein